jgi:hypothetical protein
VARQWAFLKVRISPEEKQIFDACCALVDRSQSKVIGALINKLADDWRSRLKPDGWERFLKKELTRSDLRAIHKRVTDAGLTPAASTAHAARCVW